MSAPEGRDWMYAERRPRTWVPPWFKVGVDQFIEFCLRHPDKMRGLDLVKCPCKKCHNTKYQPIDNCKVHLYKNGFVDGYHCWIHQGEVPGLAGGVTQDVPVDPYREMVMDAFAHDPGQDMPNFTHTNEEEPSLEHKKFFDLLDACTKKVWSGRDDMSLIECVSRLLNFKSDYNLSDAGYDTIMQIIHDLLPSGDNNLPKNFYETKRLMSGLGMTHEKIDCCVNNCMLFRGIHSEKVTCLYCGKSRYNTSKSGKVPQKYMFYFPLKARLKRLYLSRATASKMTWHVDHKHDEDGEMCHPSDSPAWRDFNTTHPEFATEGRNVRLGLCTDGFNPFGQYGSQYSCWPVLVMPYNLPPDMCMKEETMFLTCLVPGPKSPTQRLDVFLQPLIDELLELWNDGVLTYDVSTKENFTLRAALMWTISDLPAYAMLSGWSTYGGFTACPICMDETVAIRLENGGKQSWFDAHRRFLPEDHSFRQDRVNFIAGRVEDRAPPKVRSGEDLLADIDRYGLVKVTEHGGVEHNADRCQSCGWKKRSIFWDLPYWKTNLIRHCLDPMHCEKNIFENFFFTILDVVGKTKDNVKSRLDLKLLCARPSLDKHPRSGKYPKAAYALSKKGRNDLLEWVSEVKFPDGYASRLKRCVDMRTGKMHGMKSHDCHIFMQRLIPIAFKELLPKHVWEPLSELSHYFRCLMTRVIHSNTMAQLDGDIVVILCKLEQIFPPKCI